MRANELTQRKWYKDCCLRLDMEEAKKKKKRLHKPYAVVVAGSWQLTGDNRQSKRRTVNKS